jgi:RNA polymerase sigma-70 factor (ECF subfamily)
MVQALRRRCMRFARTQLRNDAWAEDAVSETMLAALEKPQAFGGQSQLKTWLVGILKHKVIDQLRRHSREATVLSSDDDNADLDEQLFRNGHWREAPKEWGDPEARAAPARVLRSAGSLRQPPARHPGPHVHDARMAGTGDRRDL